jgi:hypothetical protein
MKLAEAQKILNLPASGPISKQEILKVTCSVYEVCDVRWALRGALQCCGGVFHSVCAFPCTISRRCVCVCVCDVMCEHASLLCELQCRV